MSKIEGPSQSETLGRCLLYLKAQANYTKLLSRRLLKHSVRKKLGFSKCEVGRCSNQTCWTCGCGLMTSPPIKFLTLFSLTIYLFRLHLYRLVLGL